jgi:hypothetical protein
VADLDAVSLFTKNFEFSGPHALVDGGFPEPQAGIMYQPTGVLTFATVTEGAMSTFRTWKGASAAEVTPFSNGTATPTWKRGTSAGATSWAWTGLTSAFVMQPPNNTWSLTSTVPRGPTYARGPMLSAVEVNTIGGGGFNLYDWNGIQWVQTGGGRIGPPAVLNQIAAVARQTPLSSGQYVLTISQNAVAEVWASETSNPPWRNIGPAGAQGNIGRITVSDSGLAFFATQFEIWYKPSVSGGSWNSFSTQMRIPLDIASVGRRIFVLMLTQAKKLELWPFDPAIGPVAADIILLDNLSPCDVNPSAELAASDFGDLALVWTELCGGSSYNLRSSELK